MSKTSEQTITISKVEFMRVMNEVSTELGTRHPAFPLIIALVSALLIQKLFDKDDLLRSSKKMKADTSTLLEAHHRSGPCDLIRRSFGDRKSFKEQIKRLESILSKSL